jgi:tRNA-specific 2-thiouridylase
MAKVLVAASGGVDSSSAILLLRERGYDVVACILRMHEYAQSAIDDCHRVCDAIGVPLIVEDVSDSFRNIVKRNFVEEYLRGRTPNPCVLCNQKVKFKSLLDTAQKLGIEYIATGHYANIALNEQTGRYTLRTAEAINKDQTYMLWRLQQDILSKLIFPLGNFTTKDSVRNFAHDSNIPVFDKGDSQDICFLPNNDYVSYISDAANDFNIAFETTAGDIVLNGAIIGKHTGYTHYTIGQRRGLGIAYKEPLYVKSIDAANNIVEVATIKDTYVSGLIADEVNLQKYSDLPHNSQFIVKIRYKDIGKPACCNMIDGRLHILFSEPRGGVALGQSAVMYEGGELVGGGIISEVIF